MKVEEYIWSFLLFLLIFLVHYALGRIYKKDAHDSDSKSTAKIETNIFRAVKFKRINV
jgi:hypothetical protein